MKKLLRTTVLKLFSIFKGACCGALISIAPVALVQHKHLIEYFQCLDWSILTFFVVSIVTGAIVCFLLPRLPNKKALLALGYLFFYTACAALCQKMGLTLLTDHPYQLYESILPLPSCLLTVIPGLLLICLATTHFVTNTFNQSDSASTLDSKPGHSQYLSWLLFMSGTPLIFSVWLPLLAIPGAWVITRWLD